MKQRRRDSARQRHPSYSISKRRTLKGRFNTAGRHQRRGDAAARPECGRIVASAFRIRPARSVCVSARVDDFRIPRANMLNVDLELAARGGKKVGEKHIAGFCEAIEQLAALRMSDIQPDAALAAIGLLHEEVDAARRY